MADLDIELLLSEFLQVRKDDVSNVWNAPYAELSEVELEAEYTEPEIQANQSVSSLDFEVCLNSPVDISNLDVFTVLGGSSQNDYGDLDDLFPTFNLSDDQSETVASAISTTEPSGVYHLSKETHERQIITAVSQEDVPCCPVISENNYPGDKNTANFAAIQESATADILSQHKNIEVDASCTSPQIGLWQDTRGLASGPEVTSDGLNKPLIEETALLYAVQIAAPRNPSPVDTGNQDTGNPTIPNTTVKTDVFPLQFLDNPLQNQPDDQPEPISMIIEDVKQERNSPNEEKELLLLPSDIKLQPEVQTAAEAAVMQGSDRPLLIEVLRTKIQLRRVKEGKGEIKVSFEDKPTIEPSPEEKEKAERRKQMNLESAKRSRKNQQEKEKQLEEDEEKYTTANEDLETEIRLLRQEIDGYNQTLTRHKCKRKSAQTPSDQNAKQKRLLEALAEFLASSSDG